MSIRPKLWPLERTQGKKLTMDDGRRTPDTARSQKLTMSTSCSGELKTFAKRKKIPLHKALYSLQAHIIQLIDRLYGLMPLSTLFQLYRAPIHAFPVFKFTSALHDILSQPLPDFLQNNHRKNGQQ